MTRLDATGNEPGGPTVQAKASGTVPYPEAPAPDTDLPSALHQLEVALCVAPEVGAMLTGEPQTLLAVEDANGRTFLTQRTHYPNGTNRLLVVAAEGPAPHDIA